MTVEVRGDQRRLHKEELHDFHHSPKIFPGDQMRWADHVVCMGKGEFRTLLWWVYLGE